jgi:two-component system response regulator DegU
MGPVKVLLVDDHVMFSESLAHLLSTKTGIDVVGVAESGEEALRKTKSLKPSIVLMDIEMKGLDGIETTRILRQTFPETEVIVVTMHPDEEYIVEAIKAGAKGYVLKHFSSSFILEAINSVAQGQHAFDPKSSADVLKSLGKLIGNKDEQGEGQLTAREVKILRLISDGHTNKDVSRQLNISVHTVRNHLTHIFSKLGCANRTKAVREAQKRRLI